MITKQDIEKLATLSRLKLTDAEKEKYAKDMEHILAYIKQLDTISGATEKGVSGEREVLARSGGRSSKAITPFSGATPHNVMRGDNMPHESGIFTKDLVKAAPRSEGDFIKVKKILS